MSMKLDKSIKSMLNVFKTPSIYSLGQNFLKNEDIAGRNKLINKKFKDKLIEIAKVQGCEVIDIGAGPGTLSKSCIKAGALKIHAIEIDQRFTSIFEVINVTTI